MIDTDFEMKVPPNHSPIGNPGPFGVIELGGMFNELTIDFVHKPFN